MAQVVLRLREAGGGAKKVFARTIAEVALKIYIAMKVVGRNSTPAMRKFGQVTLEALSWLGRLLIVIFELAIEGAVIIGNEMKKYAVVIFKDITKSCVRNKKRIKSAAISCVVGTMICAGLILTAMSALGIFNNYKFSTQNWVENPSNRMKMIDSLESDYDILSMNRGQVEKLLGQPDVVLTKSNCEYKVLDDVEYDNLAEYQLNNGSKSLADVVEKHLMIAYDGNGKAVWSDVMISDSMK